MNLHQEMYTIWNRYYLYMSGHEYYWRARDERHLKNIREAIEFHTIDICKPEQVQQKDEIILSTFRAFLKSIKDNWILANLELRLLDTKFNVLWSHANRNFPDYYNKEYEKRLELDAGINAVMKYHQHLTKLGWQKLTNMGGTNWKAPK